MSRVNLQQLGCGRKMIVTSKSAIPGMFRGALISLLLTSLAVVAAHGADGPASPCHQFYPNIPGETLLDNDTLVVQRFIIPPGQWEGVHKHPPNQLYIHVKGGEWTVRFGDKQDTYTALDGEIGWSDEGLGLDADHESQNSGAEPIHLLWVAVKPGCMAGP